MTRIKSDNIKLGGSFEVPIEQSLSSTKIKEALSKEQEIVLQGETKARQIIEDSQRQANEIIENAKVQALNEVEAIHQQAFQEGFEAGRIEGTEKIKEELSQKILAVDNFAQSTFDIKKNIVKSAHSDIIQLVLEISEKICMKQFDLDKNILKEITQGAIQSLKDKEDIKIIVNPVMAEQIRGVSDEIKEQIPQLSSIKIVEDNSVSPDGTIVESPLSRVDCRVKSQINEIAEKLMTQVNFEISETLSAENENLI
ncbi:MAG TPA: FliH/SctL family protein [Candidatus Gastranaerophilaceae bacterium]|nr:FliH/SctL family protein [Candidatus Gastranaerophilaceae bacterium]HPT41343.1 FliH/SctL family protein [Candidatus Gastranaerophilaceae bacterium]